MLLPALSKAKAGARNVQCVSQERQVMQTMLMYAGDSDDYHVPATTTVTALGANYCYWLPYLLSLYQERYNAPSLLSAYDKARKSINTGRTIARCPQLRLASSAYDTAYLGGAAWSLPAWFNYGMHYTRFSNNGTQTNSIKLSSVNTPAHAIFAADSPIDPLTGTWPKTGLGGAYGYLINRGGWDLLAPDTRHNGFRANGMLVDGHVESFGKDAIFGDSSWWQ
jgi:prepilin-type processing-associated H-X9-DG protein